jgi:hypothetical protein
MRISVLVVAALLPSSVMADSCVTLERSTVINRCQACVEVTVRELRPARDQAAGTFFTGVPRTVWVEAGRRATLQGGERWAVADMRICQ